MGIIVIVTYNTLLLYVGLIPTVAHMLISVGEIDWFDSGRGLGSKRVSRAKHWNAVGNARQLRCEEHGKAKVRLLLIAGENARVVVP